MSRDHRFSGASRVTDRFIYFNLILPVYRNIYLKRCERLGSHPRFLSLRMRPRGRRERALPKNRYSVGPVRPRPGSSVRLSCPHDIDVRLRARSSHTHTRRFPTFLVKASQQDQRAVHVTAHPVRTRTNCNRYHWIGVRKKKTQRFFLFWLENKTRRDSHLNSHSLDL